VDFSPLDNLQHIVLAPRKLTREDRLDCRSRQSTQELQNQVRTEHRITRQLVIVSNYHERTAKAV
jgi:hypothetical protein